MVSKRVIAALLVAMGLSGCSLSPASLSCGVDQESSYVSLSNTKDLNPQTVRTYTELCGFAHEEGGQVTARLNILDSNTYANRN